MRRLAALSLTAWVLIIGPALCQGGLLEHACACPNCRDECPDEGCPSGHACQNDPCGTHVIRHRSVDSEDETRLIQPPAPAVIRLEEDLNSVEPACHWLPEPELVSLPNLSWAQRCQPLLL